MMPIGAMARMLPIFRNPKKKKAQKKSSIQHLWLSRNACGDNDVHERKKKKTRHKQRSKAMVVVLLPFQCSASAEMKFVIVLCFY